MRRKHSDQLGEPKEVCFPDSLKRGVILGRGDDITNGHPEEFKNAGMIFGAGMTL